MSQTIEDRTQLLHAHPGITMGDKAELSVLHNALRSTLLAYQEKPSVANSKARKTAKADLEETVERLWRKYHPDQAQQNLASIAAAHAWLQAAGYNLTERSVRNHIDVGMLPARRAKNGKVEAIRMQDLERYARTHLAKNEPDPGNDRDRLLKAQADKIELENDLKRGRYLDAAEEEQRDAAVLSAFRRHLEAAAADRLADQISTIIKELPKDQRNKITALQPAWLQQDLDFLATMFDQFQGA